MTHENVEILIGKLVTDEELREAFQQNPHAVLTWLRHQGLQLSSLEMEALTSISPSDLNALADMIDRRLQKASLRRSHMTRTGQDTETPPTMPLGTTDMRITRVGFGAWAIGGGGWAFAWGNQDDADSIAAIRHAVERRVNWIDTAAAYGLGHSEEIVARALRDIPVDDRPYVFTKARRACARAPSPPRARPNWARTTGAPAPPISPARGYAAIWPWRTRCGRSRSGTARLSPQWRSPGRSPGPV